jgi:hypothetical protein
MFNKDGIPYPRFKDPSKVKHGTKSGYDYHRRQLKEEPCTACSLANSQHWKEQRKLRGTEINAKRRARRAIVGHVQTGMWFNSHLTELIELYGADCHICKTPIDFNAPRKVGKPGWENSFHPDHLIPLSKGGENAIENVRPAHAKCNMRKWASVTP